MEEKIPFWAARLAHPIWLSAAVAAGLPTWEWWRFQAEPGDAFYGFEFFGFEVCSAGRSGFEWTERLLSPARSDVEEILGLCEIWGIPALLVAGAFLTGRRSRDPRVAGRRAAAVLALMAVLRPLTFTYADTVGCGWISMFSGAWFAEVADAWGSVETNWLTASALMLLAAVITPGAQGVPFPASAMTISHRGEPLPLPAAASSGAGAKRRPSVSGGDPVSASRALGGELGAAPAVPYGQVGGVWRRTAALLVDYFLVVHILGTALEGLRSVIPVFSLGAHGLLSPIDSSPFEFVPEQHSLILAVFLCFWFQYALWGRTLGQRLLGLRAIPEGVSLTAFISGGRPGPRGEAGPGALTRGAVTPGVVGTAGVAAGQDGGRRLGLGGGRAALRALAFPVLALLPGFGTFWLIADAVVALLSPDGRALHDVVAGTAVVRRRWRRGSGRGAGEGGRGVAAAP
ncbi:RDD family protein [Microtetraspora niveoalba]|uniref:RDD family protein n=1 Tax=Microtetraspora niveoalba TaxID=46175 RepID=UPI0008308DF2|nr:RDD family protein [Microtetraspora niveoalba]